MEKKENFVSTICQSITTERERQSESVREQYKRDRVRENVCVGERECECVYV